MPQGQRRLLLAARSLHASNLESKHFRSLSRCVMELFGPEILTILSFGGLVAGLGVRVFGLGGLVAGLGWLAVWRRLSFGSEAQSLAFFLEPLGSGSPQMCHDRLVQLNEHKSGNGFHYKRAWLLVSIYVWRQLDVEE
ncbi:hypothetical protein NC653_036863 [Populus alba x Populus x berolinensis]|uniref:Uncharacterized protein n=1 Tax=Populus alba x Populus x berolinensis TaxID=444605 RepID=A0AAD6PVF8_9ROSI|nr:hypothetical protein NC653_036863 [Populus alba x Populus x berolinensis]